MTALEFHDESPDDRKRYNMVTDDVLAQLRAHPGKWAKIGERRGEKNRVTIHYQRKAGPDFTFTTHWNAESQRMEVWASFQPSAS